jgi:hypothetical protein
MSTGPLQTHFDATRAGLFDLVVEAALTLQWLEQWAVAIRLEAKNPVPSDGRFREVLEHRLAEVDKRVQTFEGRLSGLIGYAMVMEEAPTLRREMEGEQ